MSDNFNAPLFDLRDYQGQRVVIERSWWESHVQTPRPKMANHMHEVRDAIAMPAFVNQDKDFPKRRCFYGAYTSRNPRLMLKVVVEYDADEGHFITAYPCSRPGSGEVRLWTNPTS